MSLYLYKAKFRKSNSKKKSKEYLHCLNSYGYRDGNGEIYYVCGYSVMIIYKKTK